MSIKWKRDPASGNYTLLSDEGSTGFTIEKARDEFQEVTLRRKASEHPHPKEAFEAALKGGDEFYPTYYKLVFENRYWLCFQGERLVYDERLAPVRELGYEAQRRIAFGRLSPSEVSRKSLQSVCQEMNKAIAS